MAPLLLAFGDSLTAGYGLAPDQSFAARLQARLRGTWSAAEVLNAGVSGDTTADGLRRLPRILAQLQRRPNLAIVELGANDLLRGIAPPQTEANLDAILTELERCGIPVLLATFTVPPFVGAAAARYDAIHPSVAARHGVATKPFFPAGVMGHPAMVLRDRLHPNATAIERVVDGFLPAVIAALDRASVDA